MFTSAFTPPIQSPKSHPQFFSRTPVVVSLSSLIPPGYKTLFQPYFFKKHPIIAAPNTSRHSVQTPSEQARETGNLSVDLQVIVSAQVQVQAEVEKGCSSRKNFDHQVDCT